MSDKWTHYTESGGYRHATVTAGGVLPSTHFVSACGEEFSNGLRMTDCSVVNCPQCLATIGVHAAKRTTSTMQEIEVTVQTAYPAPGTEVRSGLVCDEYPGLAVTPTVYYDFLNRTNYESGWSVTHVPSGIALCHGLPTQEVAIEAIRQLTQITDWTQGQAEIEALPESVKEEARGIVRALQLDHNPFFALPAN